MEYVRLKVINEYKSKSINPAKTPNTLFEVYSVPTFSTGRPEYLLGNEIASNKASVQKNDILLCKINPRINRVWVVGDESDNPNIASSEWIVVRSSKYNPEFLAWYFRSPKFKKLMVSEVTGIGGSLTRAQPKAVAEYPVPVIARPEQDAVAATLNLVDRIIASRQQQLQKLDELVKARFVEMFGGIHDSNKYPYKLLEELTDVISGGTPSRDISEYWEYGTIPWVKTTELKNNILTETEEHITGNGLNNSSAKIVPLGTILLAMYGQGKTRGMTAYLAIEACTNQACACILPSDKVNQAFLWRYLILSYDNLRDMAKGGNQPNLNGKIIKNYPILYPPLDLQNQFAAFVSEVDKSKAAVQKALDEAQLLFDSLMQKYFE